MTTFLNSASSSLLVSMPLVCGPQPGVCSQNEPSLRGLRKNTRDYLDSTSKSGQWHKDPNSSSETLLYVYVLLYLLIKQYLNVTKHYEISPHRNLDLFKIQISFGQLVV